MELPLPVEPPLKAEASPLCPALFGKDGKDLDAEEKKAAIAAIWATPLSKRGQRAKAMLVMFCDLECRWAELDAAPNPYPPGSLSFVAHETAPRPHPLRELDRNGKACAVIVLIRDMITTAGYACASLTTKEQELFRTCGEGVRRAFVRYELLCGGAACVGRCSTGCWL